MQKLLGLTAAAFILASCGNSGNANVTTKAAQNVTSAAQEKTANSSTNYSTASFDGAKLDAILDARPDAVKARYDARHPAETLEFFGITPGMSIGEALPGGGWYTKILAPYLGENGKIVGIDYNLEMWPEFSFATEQFIETKKTWPETFVAESAEWLPADGPKIGATTFGSPAGDMAGSLDAILFIRALHNLSRFETEGDYLTKALSHSRELLKEDGIIGVVQHRAPELSLIHI